MIVKVGLASRQALGRRRAELSRGAGKFCCLLGAEGVPAAAEVVQRDLCPVHGLARSACVHVSPCTGHGGWTWPG